MAYVLNVLGRSCWVGFGWVRLSWVVDRRNGMEHKDGMGGKVQRTWPGYGVSQSVGLVSRRGILRNLGVVAFLLRFEVPFVEVPFLVIPSLTAFFLLLRVLMISFLSTSIYIYFIIDEPLHIYLSTGPT